MTNRTPPRHRNGHYATDVLGDPLVMPGFDYDAHDRWVEAGHCAVVQGSGQYCFWSPHAASLPCRSADPARLT